MTTRSEPLFDSSVIPGGKYTFYGAFAAAFIAIGYLVWKRGGTMVHRTSFGTSGPGGHSRVVLDYDEWELPSH